MSTTATTIAALAAMLANANVVVRTPQGTVQGVGEPDGSSTGGQAFYGMRYAMQPARFWPSTEYTRQWKEKVGRTVQPTMLYKFFPSRSTARPALPPRPPPFTSLRAQWSCRWPSLARPPPILSSSTLLPHPFGSVAAAILHQHNTTPYNTVTTLSQHCYTTWSGTTLCMQVYDASSQAPACWAPTGWVPPWLKLRLESGPGRPICRSAPTRSFVRPHVLSDVLFSAPLVSVAATA